MEDFTLKSGWESVAFADAVVSYGSAVVRSLTVNGWDVFTVSTSGLDVVMREKKGDRRPHHNTIDLVYSHFLVALHKTTDGKKRLTTTNTSQLSKDNKRESSLHFILRKIISLFFACCQIIAGRPVGDQELSQRSKGRSFCPHSKITAFGIVHVDLVVVEQNKQLLAQLDHYLKITRLFLWLFGLSIRALLYVFCGGGTTHFCKVVDAGQMGAGTTGSSSRYAGVLVFSKWSSDRKVVAIGLES